jgi:hypothetical protein
LGLFHLHHTHVCTAMYVALFTSPVSQTHFLGPFLIVLRMKDTSFTEIWSIVIYTHTGDN